MFVVDQSTPLNYAASASQNPSHIMCWSPTQNVIYQNHNLVTLCSSYHCNVTLASCSMLSHLHHTDSNHMDLLTHTFSNIASFPFQQHSLLHTIRSAWNHSNAYWHQQLVLDADLFTLKVTQWAAYCSDHYSPADLPQPKSPWMTTTTQLTLFLRHQHVPATTLWFKFNPTYRFEPISAASMHLLASSTIDLISLLIIIVVDQLSRQLHMSLD